MQQVTIMVDDEFKAAGDAIGALITDIKAGKSVEQISADVLPSLLPAISSYANFASDVKKPWNQAYLVEKIAEALEKAAPAPAAPAAP